MSNRGPKIAISGKSGCGNTTTSKILSEKLDIGMVNYTFRNLASDEGISFEQVRREAEKSPKWDYLVDQRQIDKANTAPCVLGSRLAIWLWKEAELKVYLTAKEEVRSSRIAQREGLDYEIALQKTKDRDGKDQQRYLKLYNIDIDDPSPADLIINVENLAPEQIVDKIITAYKEKVQDR